MIDIAQSSEEHMTMFVRLGLLKVRDVQSFWFSLPGVNHFAMGLNNGREEVSAHVAVQYDNAAHSILADR